MLSRIQSIMDIVPTNIYMYIFFSPSFGGKNYIIKIVCEFVFLKKEFGICSITLSVNRLSCY